jgi:hypothetical protein
MTEPTYLSKSAFAARIGRSPSYITWLKDNNRLVLSSDGKKVDVLATEALIADTADPSKAAVVARHHQDRLQRDVYSQLTPTAEPTSTAAPPHALAPAGQQPDFHKSRALREQSLAELSVIELRTKQGFLVEREAVEVSAYNAGRLLRDQLLRLSSQLSSEFAAMTDPWEIERHLTAELRRTLEDAERLSAADLDQAISVS